MDNCMLTSIFYAIKLELLIHLCMKLVELNNPSSTSTDFLATPEWGDITGALLSRFLCSAN